MTVRVAIMDARVVSTGFGFWSSWPWGGACGWGWRSRPGGRPSQQHIRRKRPAPGWTKRGHLVTPAQGNVPLSISESQRVPTLNPAPTVCHGSNNGSQRESTRDRMVRRVVVPSAHQSSNPRFDTGVSHLGGIFFNRRRYSRRQRKCLVTSSISRLDPPAQSLEDAYWGRMYMRAL